MFKYIKYTKAETEYTTLEFRGGDDTVKVNHFSDNETEKVSIVSIESDSEDAIDALIASQAVECVEVTKDEFKTLVRNSAQLKRIRQIVKERIALRYDVADEISMSKKPVEDSKRITYENYITECIHVGSALKNAIGY